MNKDEFQRIKEEQARRTFEEWASQPPMEWNLERFPPDAITWPGCYIDYHVHCAWDAWKAALSV